MQIRQQAWARQAYEDISRLEEKKDKSTEDKSYVEEYGRLCLRFPILVFSCGLCQAVAFFEAKAKEGKPHMEFLQHIGKTAGVLDWSKVRACSVQEYQWLTKNVLGVATWYKRYAEAILKAEPGDDSVEGGNS